MTGLLSSGGADAVGVVLVGDELLLGTVADINGSWLGRTLVGNGLRLVETCAVPDDVASIAQTVRRLADRVATVVVSGGLGPTSDDLTREALAYVSGSDLVDDPSAVAAITEWYAARGREPSNAVLRMARRPRSAQILLNPSGSAPGLLLSLSSATVYAVPGVPAELRSMVTDVVLPDLRRRLPASSPLRSTSVEVALLGESAVVSLLADVERAAAEDASVDIAYLARPAHVSVRVSVRDDDEDRARARLGEWQQRVAAALGRHVLGRDGQTLPDVVVAALVRSGASVATAESLTGGAVAAALTTVPGASQVVRGGLVTYATDLKASMLGVSPDLLAERGPVDEAVATAMATGVRRSVAADWGVATTGVAGPDPVGPHAPGHVHVAVSGPDGESTRALDLPGDRARVRRLTVAHALDELRLRLSSRESADPMDR